MRIVSVCRRVAIVSAVGMAVLASAAAPVGAQAAREEPRLALVIGNSTYREAPLRNPVNDVRSMAQRLRELGFTVLAHENATKKTMEAAIIEFGRGSPMVASAPFTTRATACKFAGETTWFRSTPKSRMRPASESPPSTWSCSSSR